MNFSSFSCFNPPARNGCRSWTAFFGPPCPPPLKTNRAKKVARSWNNKRHSQKSHRHCTLASIITDLYIALNIHIEYFLDFGNQEERQFFWSFRTIHDPCLFCFCMAMQLSGINLCRCFLRLSRNADPELSCLGMRWDTFLHRHRVKIASRTSELTFPNDVNDRIELQLAPGLSCLFLRAFSAFGAFLTSFLSLKRRQFHNVQLQNWQSKNFVQFAKSLFPCPLQFLQLLQPLPVFSPEDSPKCQHGTL